MNDDLFRNQILATLRREGITFGCTLDGPEPVLALLRDIAPELPHPLAVRVSTTGNTVSVDLISEHLTGNSFYNNQTGLKHFARWKSLYPDLCHILR